MRQYGIKDILEAKGRPGMPEPFAGKFPTRIYWDYAGDLGDFDYYGKPNVEQVRRFQKLISRSRKLKSAFCFEYDKSHRVYSWDFHLSPVPEIDQLLYYFYHLWQSSL